MKGQLRLFWLRLPEKKAFFNNRHFHDRHVRQRLEHSRQVQRQKDCLTLELPEDCNDESMVRGAYLKLVKLYHPDSGSDQADAEKFHKIDLAYKSLLKDFANFRHNRHKIEGEYGLYYQETKNNARDEEEEETSDIKHTAPQHRQYLSYGGVGSGTPFEREKQYEKYRRAKAAENVMEYRVQQISKNSGQEVSALVKDTKASKKIKTGIGMDRLVEDLIQESMARGDFDNLQGKGKPLNQSSSYNPYIDFTTHKLNQVLIDNGFAPEWIMLEKEIREEIVRIRKQLSLHRHKYDPVLTPEEEMEWRERVQGLKSDCETLNKMILKFNLTVPSLHKQMMTFQLEKEAAKALTTFSPELQEESRNQESLQRVNNANQRGLTNSKESGDDDSSFLGTLFSIFKS